MDFSVLSGCTCLLWVSVCSQPQSPCIETPAEAWPPLNFGLISMHLFHCSRLLLSWVLESIQGEELIDLGPDGEYHECCESTAWSCF